MFAKSVAREVSAVPNKPPAITEELLDYLAEVFPDKAPGLDWTEREVWQSVGAVKVQAHLRHLYDQQLAKNMKG